MWWLSQDGQRAYFAKELRASLFSDGQLIDITFSHIHLDGQYLYCNCTESILYCSHYLLWMRNILFYVRMQMYLSLKLKDLTRLHLLKKRKYFLNWFWRENLMIISIKNKKGIISSVNNNLFILACCCETLVHEKLFFPSFLIILETSFVYWSVFSDLNLLL